MNNIVEEQDVKTLKDILNKYKIREKEMRETLSKALDQEKISYENRVIELKSQVEKDLSECSNIVKNIESMF